MSVIMTEEYKTELFIETTKKRNFWNFISKVKQKYGFWFVLTHFFSLKDIFFNLALIAYHYNEIHQMLRWLNTKGKPTIQKINYYQLEEMVEKFKNEEAYNYKSTLYRLFK